MSERMVGVVMTIRSNSRMLAFEICVAGRAPRPALWLVQKSVQDESQQYTETAENDKRPAPTESWPISPAKKPPAMVPA